MELQDTLDSVAAGIRAIPLLERLPVFAEDKGNIIENVNQSIARTSFCVVVGSPSYNDKTPDSGVCFGGVRLVVTIFEKPVLNRTKPNCLTYLRAAQTIAKAMKLFNTGDGLLVTKSIAPPKDLGDGVVACDVSFELDTTL